MLIITTRELHFSFVTVFLPKDVAHFPLPYHVPILSSLLAEGLIPSFREDKCIATMINTCAKGKKNLI